MTLLRSEIMAAYWKGRYVRDEVEADEMEAGIERALRGDVTDAEWVAASHERRRAALSEGLRRPQTLESASAVLKALYSGPIAQ